MDTSIPYSRQVSPVCKATSAKSFRFLLIPIALIYFRREVDFGPNLNTLKSRNAARYAGLDNDSDIFLLIFTSFFLSSAIIAYMYVQISECQNFMLRHPLQIYLIFAAGLEAQELEWVRDGRTLRRWSSTILSQAVHHATEHRAQLIDALEFRSYTPINLDDIDLWAFDQFEKDNAG